MTVFAAFATLVCQRNSVFLCKGTKAQEFGEAEFLESLPVFALECFSANETGILITEFWDSMPVYRFCRLCNQVLPKTLRFSLQRHKSSRILQSRILG